MFVAAAAVAAALGAFEPASIWRTAPAALLVFMGQRSCDRRGDRFLAISAAVYSILVLVTAPNDGGGQWGPRYLLFAFIPISILTTDALTASARRLRVIGLILVAVIAASSLVVQRTAFKDLRGAKNAYGRLLEFVERETVPGGVVVTDLWWFEQVTAALYPTRVVLFVDGPASARRALSLLTEESPVSVVRSERESAGGPLGLWLAGTRFVAGAQATTRERSLVLTHLAPLRR